MTSRRNLVLLAIAAAVVLLLVIPSLRPKQTTQTAASRVVAVVAKQDIAPYTVLRNEDLTTMRILAEEAEGTYGSLQEVVGQMITTELRKGGIVDRADTLELDRRWAHGNMLVFSFDVTTDQIAGGRLRPGHHIDVLVTANPGQSEAGARALWLARDLWVVDVFQSSGADVLRPAPVYPQYDQLPTSDSGSSGSTAGGGGGLFGTGGSSTTTTQSRADDGPGNLVLVAAHRDTARMFGYYMGALDYSPWVYIRPEDMEGAEGIARIRGIVYHDVNGDGKYDPEEPGIEGASVTLLNQADEVQDTATTEEQGTFTFGARTKGLYSVKVKALEGYAFTTSDWQEIYLIEGQSEYVAFGAYSAIPTETPTPLPTEVPPTKEPTKVPTKVVVVPPPTATPAPPTTEKGHIAGTVFNDLDQNRQQGSRESWLQGVTVQWTNKDTQAKGDTQSKENGSFTFYDLPVGTYDVEVVKNSQFSPTSAGPTMVTIKNGETANVTLGAIVTGSEPTGILPQTLPTTGETEIDLSLELSETAAGGTTTTFPEGMAYIWLGITCDECAQGTELALSTTLSGSEAEVAAETVVWDQAGAGTMWVRMWPSGNAGSFAAGHYETVIHAASDGYRGYGIRSWSVASQDTHGTTFGFGRGK